MILLHMLRERTPTLTHSFKKGRCQMCTSSPPSRMMCLRQSTMQYQCFWLLVCSHIALKGIRKHSTALALKHLFQKLHYKSTES